MDFFQQAFSFSFFVGGLVSLQDQKVDSLWEKINFKFKSLLFIL
jgi:hypothetical protein